MNTGKAVITIYNGKNDKRSYQLGIYMMWGGGPAYVKAFLTYMKFIGCRPPERDSYGWGALVRVLANYGIGAVGLGSLRDLDVSNYDNGLYVIKNWDIVKQKYQGRINEDGAPIRTLLEEIDAAQPKRLQKGKAAILQWLNKHSDIERRDPYKNTGRILAFPRKLRTLQYL